MDAPSIGRIVIYRTDDGRSVPAVIAGTIETGYVPDAGELSSTTHVHLFVLDPAAPAPTRVLDVGFDEDFGPVAGADEAQITATWRWPVIVRPPGPPAPPRPDEHRPVA